MARRVKYRKPVRTKRLTVAKLLQRARQLIQAGRCKAAADAYNDAVMKDYDYGLGLKESTFRQVQRKLQYCRRTHGWDRY